MATGNCFVYMGCCITASSAVTIAIPLFLVKLWDIITATSQSDQMVEKLCKLLFFTSIFWQDSIHEH